MAKRNKATISFNKSYVLGEELEISGSFLYDGIEYIKNIDHHDPKHNVELFLAFYHLSVGIERLLKILILVKSSGPEKIKTHDIDTLINKLKKRGIDIKFSVEEYEALGALSNFYENVRYQRLSFEFKDISNNTEEFDLINCLGGYDKAPTVISDISKTIYKEIQKITRQKGLFTDGIRPNSKSYAMFN